MKRTPRSQIAQLFLTLLEKESKNTAIKALAALIITERRLGEVDLILRDISQAIMKQKNYIEVEVTTAREVNAAVLDEIQALFQNKMHVQTANINTTIDSTIIGGFIARTPAYELNASLQHKLSAWRSHV